MQKPLTDDEIAKLWPGSTTWAALFEFARRIEKAHGISEETEEMQRVQEAIRRPVDVLCT